MEEELQQLRDALFPPVPFEVAKDPMKVAWDFRGIQTSSMKYGGQWWYILRSGIWKLWLIAVATLQEQDIPATPRAVCEQLNGTNAYATVQRKLKYLTQEWLDTKAWGIPYGWTYKGGPLMRVKYGRTYRYYIVEPKADG